MVVVPSAVLEKQAAPDLSFWEECKRQAEILNIPAWMIAEEGFKHPVDLYSLKKR
jgi:hypothetical protein|tara:strand:+ start:261 stop:425 length:165 start_codon:yes stop_codon:yes gene_type:complete